MEAFTLDPAHIGQPDDLVGTVVCEEVRANGRRLFHKGHRLTRADLSALPDVDHPLHLMRLGPDDIHEDEAGRRLATVMAGPGLGETIYQKGPIQSRVNLFAARKGLLRVNRDAIVAMNRHPGIAVFTLPDRLSVVPGKMIAGAKITPVAVPAGTLAAAEAIARDNPVVRLIPFRPLTVGVVSTEAFTDKTRDRFRDAVTKKIGWYGGTILRFEDLDNTPAAVAVAVERQIADGADLVLTGGGNTIDPLDAALQALPHIGADIVKYGAPAHPGSMFWLAYRGATPIFNLASCSMYSKATVADLVLPWVMAGEHVTLDDLAGIGYGGLLDRDMAYRFPPYDADAAQEDDEE